MNSYQLLNNIEHSKIKINLDRKAELGDDVMFTMTFPFEFRLILAYYPILIYQDKNSDKTFPIALCGFEEGENLFLDDNGWNARYIPVMVQRQPFMIGFQQKPDSDEKSHVITFDPEHPRVNTEVGELVFNEQGGYTPYLEKVIKMLESMDIGNTQNDLLAEALKKHDLLEPSTISITLKDGSNFELVGFSTIAEDKFEALSAEALDELNKQKLLIPITLIMASMSNLGKLVEMRNAKLG